MSGTIARHWKADAGWQYTTDTSQTQRLNAGFQFAPEPGKVVNIAYRYTNGALITNGQVPTVTVINPTNPSNTLRQLDISGQWPIRNHLSAIARWNYSTADSRLIEGLAGFEYDGGCWAFRAVAHSFATSSTTSVSQFFLQLQLNGVSNFGSNALDLLRRNVAGYYRPEPQSSRPEDMYPIR